MKLNRAELRKILYDFNSISNRLLQTDFQDYNGVLPKFLNFIKSNDIIYDYIQNCGECTQDLDAEFDEIRASYGRCIFTIGDSDEEEVRNIFAILCYIVDKKLAIHLGVAQGYSSSRKYQDFVDGFNNRVVLVLIRNIERYLTKIGIDMGIDEKTTYSITIRNGQVNIANDGSTINSMNTIYGAEAEKLLELIQNIKNNSGGLTAEDSEKLSSSLEVIEEEVKTSKPRMSFLKVAITTLNSIKGTVEFAAAIAALIQFINSLT